MSEDRGLLYGDGLFETVAVVDGEVRWLELHVARLRRSGAFLGFPEAHLERGVLALRALVGARAGLWRVTVTRPGAGLPWGGTGDVYTRWRALPGALPPASVTVLRGWHVPGDVLAEHKTTSYLRAAEARRRASAEGFDEAIRVSHDGVVGEACAANLLLVIGGALVTPGIDGVLPGVTRQGILRAASERGVEIEEREVRVAELERCREVMLLSAGVGVRSVGALDGRGLEVIEAKRVRAWLE